MLDLSLGGLDFEEGLTVDGYFGTRLVVRPIHSSVDLGDVVSDEEFIVGGVVLGHLTEGGVEHELPKVASDLVLAATHIGSELDEGLVWSAGLVGDDLGDAQALAGLLKIPEGRGVYRSRHHGIPCRRRAFGR